MNQYVLSLGSNLPPRETHLLTALKKLSQIALIKNVAPLFENPPLLPPKAPESWYHFFLNTAVWIETELSPEPLLEKLRSFEVEAGRTNNLGESRAKWAPRPLDIDIIFMLSPSGESLTYTSAQLQIPHPSWQQRNFVVTPVMHVLKNNPQSTSLSLLSQHRALSTPLCAFSAILNVTPDSFSEENNAHETHLQKMGRLLNLHPAVLDMGAESTRPGATPLSADEEWLRLEPFLTEWKETRQAFPFTKLSLDTRHAQTAQRALDYSVSLLNDVSGLNSPAMQEVASNYESVILMHSLSVPADPQQVFAETTNPTGEIQMWFEKKLSSFLSSQPKLSAKIIFDPGIGFGKTPVQSLVLLQNLKAFRPYNIPLLIGHSRKSFMNLWSEETFSERDYETLGVSASLLSQVEFLRIHHLEAHQRLQKSLLALAGAK